jgi:hypothetical protein
MIDPDIEKSGLELSAALGKSFRKMMIDSGVPSEEVDEIMYRAVDSISVDGVPIHSDLCPNCGGRGWIRRERETQ